jgi:hypothetical protein
MCCIRSKLTLIGVNEDFSKKISCLLTPPPRTMFIYAVAYDVSFFFSNYIVYRKHLQRAYTHPYEHTCANPTLRSIFKDWADKSSRLIKLT